jgi:hypothetical protein
VWEHERHGEQVQLLHLRRPVDSRAQGKVSSPLLQEAELRGLPVCEELAVEVVLDLNTPRRSQPHGISKSDRRSAPGGLLVYHDRHLELGLVVALRLGGERRGEETTSQCAEECAPVHHSIT